MLQVRKHLCHPDLAIVALAIVRVQRHKAHADFERQLRELYGPLVCKATIPDSVLVSVACSHHMTVGEYAPASPAAKALEQLVKELTRCPKVWTQSSGFWPQRSASQANGEPADDQADGETNGQSRGTLRAPRPRAKKDEEAAREDPRLQGQA